MNAGQASSVIYNIYQNVPDSSVRDSIKQFEEKLATNAGTIEITRKDLNLLTLALKDLEQRTAAIEKLPDGRTRLGGFVAGYPGFLIQELHSARSNYVAGNYIMSHYHATNGIDAYERSPNGSFDSSVTLTGEAVGGLYGLGSSSAFRNGNYEAVPTLGKKSFAASDKVEQRILVAAALARLSRTNETLAELTNAIVKFPNDTRPPFYRDGYSDYFSGRASFKDVEPRFE